jgi:WD40 repeat protein
MSKTSEKVLGIETEGVCTTIAQISKTWLALSSNELIEIWDLKTETLKATLGGHEDVVFGLFPLKPTAHIFASSSNDKTIRIWKANTKMCLKVINTLQIGSVFSLCELNGKLVTSSTDHTVK